MRISPFFTTPLLLFASPLILLAAEPTSAITGEAFTLLGLTIDQWVSVLLAIGTFITGVFTAFETMVAVIKKTVLKEAHRVAGVNGEKLDLVQSDVSAALTTQQATQDRLIAELAALRGEIDSVNTNLESGFANNVELTKLVTTLALDLKVAGCRFVAQPAAGPVIDSAVVHVAAPTPPSV